VGECASAWEYVKERKRDIFSSAHVCEPNSAIRAYRGMVGSNKELVGREREREGEGGREREGAREGARGREREGGRVVKCANYQLRQLTNCGNLQIAATYKL
jgi:hypothetical protein